MTLNKVKIDLRYLFLLLVNQFESASEFLKLRYLVFVQLCVGYSHDHDKLEIGPYDIK